METLANDLVWLQKWYASHCDGAWEHAYGIELQTLDNPGFALKIDLKGTELDGRPFFDIRVGDGPWQGDPQERWHRCEVTDGIFRGYGGIYSLTEIIHEFRKWAEG